MQTKNSNGLKVAAAMIAVAIAAPLAAQQSPQIDFKSVGRGAPVMVDAATLPQTGALWQGGQGGPGAGQNTGQPRTFVGSALPGETPKGIKPLPRDLFTSKDFYKDRDALDRSALLPLQQPGRDRGQLGRDAAAAIGDDPPASAAWGYCDRDYPREAIVSPYPFKTAQEHYEALLAETTKRGGPTQHTYATVPGEWTGRYASGARRRRPGTVPHAQRCRCRRSCRC